MPPSTTEIPTWVALPPGTFTQGSTREHVEAAVALRPAWMPADQTQADLIAWEHPPRQVTLTRGFRLANTPITVGQFRAFIHATGHIPESQHNGRGGAYYDSKGKLQESLDLTWERPLPDYAAADDEPVTQVTWNDAQSYCDWLGTLTDSRVRLPTEAEWEYACQGRDREWTGLGKTFLDPIAVHSSKDVQPVKTKAPNSYGLYDMLGNVWEWCSDCAAPNIYATGPATDPTGPITGGQRIRRGGPFNGALILLRSASRKGSPPHYRGRIVGFRALQELS